MNARLSSRVRTTVLTGPEATSASAKRATSLDMIKLAVKLMLVSWFSSINRLTDLKFLEMPSFVNERLHVLFQRDLYL